MNTPIHRRTLLRGLGTAVALPLLESMAKPLFAAAKTYPERMAFVYVPNGVNMDKWKLGSTLAPLVPHQKNINIIGGLAHKNAFGNGDGGGDHPAPPR
jgi:hypothetical protein